MKTDKDYKRPWWEERIEKLNTLIRELEGRIEKLEFNNDEKKL